MLSIVPGFVNEAIVYTTTEETEHQLRQTNRLKNTLPDLKAMPRHGEKTFQFSLFLMSGISQPIRRSHSWQR